MTVRPQLYIAGAVVAMMAVLKVLYRRFIDATGGPRGTGRATGFGRSGVATTGLAVSAAIAGTVGALMKRSLFCDEEKHTVILYDGASQV
jgi:hypothetical protein